MAFEPHLPEIASVIQLAVAPVFMLTAVGAILAALNSRLGRAVDRRRVLEEWLPRMSPAERPSAELELATIFRRIRFVYFSILFAVISGLFVCLLIVGAFIGAFVRAGLAYTSYTIGAMFVLAMLALIVSLLLFLREIFIAVSAPRHIPR